MLLFKMRRIFFLFTTFLLPATSMTAQTYLQPPQNAPGTEGTARPSTVLEPRVRLQDLLADLNKTSPDLQAARKRYEAAQTRPTREGALPDPRVTIGWVSNGYPWPGSGFGDNSTSNIGMQIAQEIPYPGKRDLKKGMSQKEAEAEAQMYRAKSLSLTQRLKDRFYELGFVYNSMDLLRKNQKLLQQLAKVAEIRYISGKTMQQDLIKAGVEVSIVENRLIVLEQRRRSLTAEINSLLDRPVDNPLGRPEEIDALPTLELFDSLHEKANHSSPMVLSQRALIDNRSLNVQSARREYYPDFDFMGGYYNQGMLKPMWEFKVQVKVPFFYWRKQRLGLEEARLQLTEAQRSYRSIQQDLDYRLQERYLAAQAALKLMDLYSKQIVPQSELALESSLASYETGGVDFLTVLANFTTIRDYQLNYHEKRAEYLKALAGLEELTAGSPLEANGK